MSKTVIRTAIRHIVSSIKPLDELEQEHIAFALQWIDSASVLFRKIKPDIPAIHLVSYFMIISEKRDQVLLVDHKKAQLWLPPGGHVEPDEDPKKTVSREAKEELGIEAKFLFDYPLFLTVTQTVGNIAKHTDVSLWYLLKGDPQQSLDYDLDEFNQIRWFRNDEIPLSNSDPHMGRFIKKMKHQEKSNL